MSRDEAERVITKSLYGLIDTPEGLEIFIEYINKHGCRALTDEAVIEIAELQIAHEGGRA